MLSIRQSIAPGEGVASGGRTGRVKPRPVQTFQRAVSSIPFRPRCGSGRNGFWRPASA
jgi:hypothetical protein